MKALGCYSEEKFDDYWGAMDDNHDDVISRVRVILFDDYYWGTMDDNHDDVISKVRVLFLTPIGERWMITTMM
jgi:hypothetical protein